VHCEYEPGANVPGGTFRPKQNKDNDYLIDRQAQKEKRSFSGVFGFAAQDASLQESMGPIQDHDAEKLLPSDRAIVMARRMLYEASIALEQGTEPSAVKSEAQSVRSAGVLLPREQKPQEWAKVHLRYGKDEPVYSL
jgi:phthalate 4,5-dioxygenase oxygenase subunit